MLLVFDRPEQLLNRERGCGFGMLRDEGRDRPAGGMPEAFD